MAVYIFLGKRTREGAMTIRDGPQRSVSGREYAEQLGLKILDYYATLGSYDFVTICEGPDDPTVYFKIAAFGAEPGNVSWTALPAMRSAEYIQLLDELPAG
jgi:uncharacterized protein with GYD domain